MIVLDGVLIGYIVELLLYDVDGWTPNHTMLYSIEMC